MQLESGDTNSTIYLFQRLSVAVQQGNAVAIMGVCLYLLTLVCCVCFRLLYHIVFELHCIVYYLCIAVYCVFFCVLHCIILLYCIAEFLCFVLMYKNNNY